jgi:hypothetical protein
MRLAGNNIAQNTCTTGAVGRPWASPIIPTTFTPEARQSATAAANNAWIVALSAPTTTAGIIASPWSVIETRLTLPFTHTIAALAPGQPLSDSQVRLAGRQDSPIYRVHLLSGRKLQRQRRLPEDDKFRTRAQHHESTPYADWHSRTLRNFLKRRTKLDSLRTCKPLCPICSIRLQATPEIVVESAVTAFHLLGCRCAPHTFIML